MYTYKRFIVAMCLSAVPIAVLSQPGGHDDEREKTAHTPTSDNYGQEHRAGLRYTLQAQRTRLAIAESMAGPDRQLNVQERFELRQQLRQQKRQ